MRKLLLILFGLLLAVFVSGQSVRVYNQNVRINKVAPILDLQGLGAKIYLDGATSGTATLQPPAVAGATVQTLPSSTGTLINSADTSDMLDNYPIKPEITAEVNDSIQALRDAAELGVAVLDSVNNTQGHPEYYATPNYVQGYIGSGGGGALTGQILKFIINVTTGAPTNADSIIIHSEFGGKHIDLYRNGDLQYFHTESTNTIDSTYRTNGDTVFVKPLWSNNERVEIRILEPITWSYLAIEGQESNLLDSLSLYYKLDETSGTTVDDAEDNQDGTAHNTTASNTQAKYNYSRHINYKGSIYSNYNANVNPDTIFSVSMWVWADSIGGATDYLFNLSWATSPYTRHRAYITTAGVINFVTYDSGGSTQYGSSSNIALSDSTLYHLVFTHRGNGKTQQIFVNGTDVTQALAGTTYIFAGDLLESTSFIYWGNSTYNAINNFRGYIDEPAIWYKILTQANVTSLYNSLVTHPF